MSLVGSHSSPPSPSGIGGHSQCVGLSSARSPLRCSALLLLLSPGTALCALVRVAESEHPLNPVGLGLGCSFIF